MKILMIDKFYFIQGGVERYYFELTDILGARGHVIIPFSMKHEKNFDTEFSRYFVDYIEYSKNFFLKNPIKGMLAFFRMIYSLQAKKRLELLIRETKPDIAHIHMIDHQLSPSILDVLNEYEIPVLQTVHQYKLVCPSYLFFNNRKKQICEKCLDGHFYHPIVERCHKNSALVGLMLAIESTIHKKLHLYEKNIDIFHVPSTFMGNKLKQGGVNKNKIEHLFYSIIINDYLPEYESDDYFVYCGRLSIEKGVMTLLKAMKKITSSKLIIIGDGPQRKELETFVSKNNLNNVVFVGYKSGSELKTLISRSKFLVLPSECYDNSPLSIYESFALGKPVIGSHIGGIPELINNEHCGLVFEPGNSEMLIEKINYLLKSKQRIVDLGKRARQRAEQEFSPDVHYQKLIEKYNRLLLKKEF